MSPQHSEPLSCTSHSDTDKVARMTSLILGFKFSYLGRYLTLPVDRPSLLGWSVNYSSLSFARVVYVDVDAHDGRRDPTAPPLSLSFSPPKFLSSLIACFS